MRRWGSVVCCLNDDVNSSEAGGEVVADPDATTTFLRYVII